MGSCEARREVSVREERLGEVRGKRCERGRTV